MLQGILVDLVPYTDEFFARRAEWVNGPMGEWWGMDRVMPRATLERGRAESLSEERHEASRIAFGVRAKGGPTPGAPIGTFALMNFSLGSRIAEVGAGIGEPDYWSGGFGSDAMLLIVEYGFEWLDLRRLFLTTMGTNARAQRQVEKCGFVREGARRLCVRTPRGEYTDFLWYGMLREEWPGRAVMVERLGLREKARRFAAEA